MTKQRVLVAECERDGKWWAVVVPVAGRRIPTQARRLDQVEMMAREAVALTLEWDPSSFDIEVRPKLPAKVEQLLEEATSAKSAADAAAKRASTAMRAATRELTDRGLSTRDIGRLLGVTYQRAAQLLR